MRHKIEIDDEIYKYLQRHAEPFVDNENSVLRRLLLDRPTGAHPGETPDRSDVSLRNAGDLMPFISAKILQVGDELVHEQPRKGLVHRAQVTADGWLEVAGHTPFSKVSPALRACVGHEINGWGQWIHVRSGQRLNELRAELRRRQAGDS